ncbi:MAG: sulfotransferase family protein [Hyphomicrobiales bacterium]|nr:sulfotransferase family protein [Hyphomicrobiales bacterium]
MALEIIGAGFGRTGTLSLKSALEQLGFGPCHHMSEVQSDPGQIRLWNDAAAGRADYDAIFSGFRSAVDFPTAAYWQDLLTVWPNARVILSVREAENWYGSFSQTILPLIADRAAWPEGAAPWLQMTERVVIGKALNGRTDREGILAAYRDNEAAARALVPSGRALVFDAREGWAPLCAFLGVAMPTEPYPRANTREGFADAVRSGTESTAA